MNFAQNEHFTAKKAGGIGVVVLVHALLGGALIYGLHTKIVTPQPDPVTNVTVTPPPKTVDPIKSVETQLPQRQPVYVPAPEVPPIPNAPNPFTETTVTKPAGPVAPSVPGPTDGPPVAPTPPHVVMHESVIVDPESCKPTYPIQSLQAGDEGIVRVRFEVGADGRIASSSVVKSSGFAPLDKAALNGLSKCSFKAATQDGVPMKSTLVMDYVWSIN